jgi:hypothetical protein
VWLIQFDVSGLASGATLKVSLNATYSRAISTNGEFYFTDSQNQGVGIAPGGSYAIAITTQPAGQSCAIANGSGVVSKNAAPLVASISCAASSGASEVHSQLRAQSTSAAPDLADGSGVPTARAGAAHWTNLQGELWMFGGESAGESAPTYLGDLWILDKAGHWRAGTIAGAVVAPSPRSFAATWVDLQGTLWLFGGKTGSIGAATNASGGIATLADLYRLDPGATSWVAVAATDAAPQGRYGAQTWVDAQDRLWLFGGESGQGTLNDQWFYDPATLQWTQSTNARTQ